MPLAGQDQIESVSQAMFLTVLPMGISEGDMMQAEGLYREDAHVNRGGNPWVITGFVAFPLSLGRVEPMLIRWVAPRVTGDEAQLQDTAGNIVWHSSARQGLPEADPSVRGEFWTGLKLTKLDSGTLYITTRAFGRTS